MRFVTRSLGTHGPDGPAPRSWVSVESDQLIFSCYVGGFRSFRIFVGGASHKLRSRNSCSSVHPPIVFLKRHCLFKKTKKTLSFFSQASVASASALDDVNMDFTGPVKTATKQFPMDYLKNVVLPDGRGSHHAVCCYDDNGNVDMIAVVWADRDRRCFICKNGQLRAEILGVCVAHSKS